MWRTPWEEQPWGGNQELGFGHVEYIILVVSYPVDVFIHLTKAASGRKNLFWLMVQEYNPSCLGGQGSQSLEQSGSSRE